MPRDVSQVIDEIGMGPFQWTQCLLVSGVLIADGAEILLSSSLLTALKSLWEITPFERGMMMTTIFAGVIVGGLIGGRIADYHGRRTGILVSYVAVFYFGTATAFAQGPFSMMIIRFFFGVAFGCGIGPSTTLQVETAPSKWRAHIVNLGMVGFALGEIYTAVLLVIFMPDLTDPLGMKWPFVTLFSMLPGAMLFPFAAFLLRETPHFFASNGRKNEAIQSLEYIAFFNDKADAIYCLDTKDPDLGLTCAAPETPESAAQSPDGEQDSSLLDNSAAARDVQPGDSDPAKVHHTSIKETLSILVSSEYRGIVIGGCYLCFLANFIFYGLTYALPQIFSKIGRRVTPAYQVLFVSICDLPGVLLAFSLISSKRIGHRDGLAILAAAASVLSITLISIDHVNWAGLYIGLPSSYLFKYIASAFFTLIYIYLAEVFPSKVRASGLSCCISTGRLGSILSPIMVELLRVRRFAWGEHCPFFLTASGLCLIGVAVIKNALHFEMKNATLKGAPERAKPSSPEQPSSPNPPEA